MTTVFNREELLAALNYVKPAIAGSSVVEGYKNFWFDGKFVYAYNGGLGIQLPLKTDLYCGVPGAPLLALLQTSLLKEVSFETAKNDALSVRMGKSTVTLSTLVGDIFFGDASSEGLWRFPEKVTPKCSFSLKLSQDILSVLEALKFVRKARGVRAIHYGVTVIPTEEGVSLYASDSVTLARHKLDSDAGKLSDIILPWELIVRVLALAEPGAELRVYKDYIEVGAADTRIFSNMLELDAASAESLEDIISNSLSKHKAIPLPVSLDSVLQRAEILAGDEEGHVSIAFAKGALKIFGKYKLGTIDESIPIKGELPDEASGKFKAELVRRGLAHAESFVLSGETIAFKKGKEFVYVVASSKS